MFLIKLSPQSSDLSRAYRDYTTLRYLDHCYVPDSDVLKGPCVA